MTVLLTDSEEVYNSHSSDKILTDGFVILESSFFSESERVKFNARLNGMENEASRKMIEELESVSRSFPPFQTHASVESRGNNYDKAYSLLYPNFKDFVTKKYLIELLVEKLEQHLGKAVDYIFNFSDAHQSLAHSELLKDRSVFTFRKTITAKNRRPVKNLFYRWSKWKRNKKHQTPAKHRIALFLFDTPNDIDLFRTFFDKVKDDRTVQLYIIQIESGISADKAVSAKPFECENIRVFKLQDFRSPLIGGLNDFNRKLDKHYPEYRHFIGSAHQLSFETYSAFIQAALLELKPMVTLYDNTGETGRHLSDVARALNIPSANVEYGLFSNDFIHMTSNIRYDVRYCLGEASISTWKEKKDPTPEHIPIGFLKLDHSEQVANGSDRFEWLGGKFEKIIFFASTWSGTSTLYNLEKTLIVNELAELCSANNWALVIKKHPAETDTLLDNLESVKQQNVFLYHHHEAPLFHLLEKCDVVCTQNSSITAEGLVHGKPTIFYNKSEQPGLAELIPMSEEPFVFFANNAEQFADIIKTQIPSLSPDVYQNALSKYLYKTDQNASFRLLEGLKKQIL